MGCSDITSGRIRACKNSIGGTANIYIYNFLEDPFEIDELTNTCTGINILLTEVFKFELEGDNNTIEESKAGDRNTATSINTQTLNFVLKKSDAATTLQMNLLAGGYPQVVVEDRNGEFTALALDDGMDFTIVKSTGGAKTDLNGYTNTGIATTGDLAPTLDETTVTAFLALVA